MTQVKGMTGYTLIKSKIGGFDPHVDGRITSENLSEVLIEHKETIHSPGIGTRNQSDEEDLVVLENESPE